MADGKRLLRKQLKCCYCNGDLDRARHEATGYNHCQRNDCVSAWRLDRIHSNDLHLVLVPKVGQTWVKGSSEIGNGKSSGK